MQKSSLGARRCQTADGSDGGFEETTRRGEALRPIEPDSQLGQVGRRLSWRWVCGAAEPALSVAARC